MDILTKLFGDDFLMMIKNLLRDFKDNSLSEEEIMLRIKDLNESSRICMYLLALKNDLEMALKIERVNKRLKDYKIDEFKKAFKKDKAVKYLEKLNKIDKISLLSDMNLNVLDVNDLTLEEKEYYQVISQSIKHEQEVDFRDGLSKFFDKKNLF